MTRAKAIVSKIFVLTLLLGAGALVAPREAQAQVVFYPPSPVFVATARPEYYGGHPVYYHHNNWYYRDHRGWNYYRSEPRYLHERRSSWGERPRYYYRR